MTDQPRDPSSGGQERDDPPAGPPMYGQPVYGPPAYSQQPPYGPPQPAYAPPQPAYGPPQRAYGPPQPAYGPPAGAPYPPIGGASPHVGSSPAEGGSPGDGFLASLMDFGFARFGTPAIVNVLYPLVAVVVVLYYIFTAATFFQFSFGLGVFWLLVLGPLAGVVVLAAARLTMEFYLNVTRIARDVQTMQQGGSHDEHAQG